MTYIIAEAETQFYNVISACHAVCAAKNAGADAIKFQMFAYNEPLFCPLPGDKKRWPRWQNSLLNKDQWLEVRNCCECLEIDFLASVFQDTMLAWLLELEPHYYKVASRAIGRYPYDAVPGPFLISCGMENWRESESKWQDKEHYLLQCNMTYPCPPERWDAKTYDGLSDHSGIVGPGLHAIANGAMFLEVHVDFGGAGHGPDSERISLEALSFLCRARDSITVMREDSDNG